MLNIEHRSKELRDLNGNAAAARYLPQLGGTRFSAQSDHILRVGNGIRLRSESRDYDAMKKRFIELFGLMCVGDGLATVLEPERHCMLWDVGPEPCRKMMDAFVEHPTMTRSLGFLEMLFGLWLASRQQPDASEFARFSH